MQQGRIRHSAFKSQNAIAAPFHLAAWLLVSLLSLAKSMLKKSRPAAEHRHPCLCGRRASSLLSLGMQAGCPLAVQPGWLCSSLAAPFLLVALLLLSLLSVARADAPDDPVFAGQTITIANKVYTFDSWAESGSTVENETFTVRTDTYVNAEGTVSLTGRLPVPQPAQARVIGNAGGVPFSGIWSGGAYHSSDYYPRTSGAPIAVPDGQVFWVAGGDYMAFTADWQLQFSHSKDIYRYSNWALFTVEVDSAGNGPISGARKGCMFSGTPYYDHPVSASTCGGPDSYELFATTYSITRVEFSISNSGDAPLLGATEKYVGGNGGTLSVSHPDILASPVTGGTFLGNDPVMGDFGGSFNVAETLVFQQDRSAPSFAGRNLWVNSTLVTWTPAPIGNTAGDVADTYVGTGLQVIVHGNLPAFKKTQDAVNPTVEIHDLSFAGPPVMGTYVKAAPSYFSVPGWYVGAADFTRLAPLCLPSTPSLWADGTRYLFRGGVDDGTGSSVDTYVNASVGEIVLTGNWSAANHIANVRVSYSGMVCHGTYNVEQAGVFVVRDSSNSPIPVADSGPAPSAFWVNGNLYRLLESSDFDYVDASDHTLTATPQGEQGAALALSGTDAVSAFTGSWTKGTALFRCTRSTGQAITSCPARWDGALMLDVTGASQVLPPAIKVQDLICPYICTSSEDESPNVLEAYYGHASPGGTGNLLLRIRLDDATVTRTVTLVDYAAQATTTGSYSTATHLFQSARGQLPVPIYGVDPLQNNERWGWLIPDNGRPATVLVAGDVWGYTGSDAAGDHYAGYHPGEGITIAHGRDGYGVVTLNTDAGSYSGTYYNNAFVMADGPEVASGDKAGTYVAPTGLSLSTTGADLDVLGNLFSLGSLKTNASIVGLTLQFADVEGTAKLYSTLSRPQAEWIWNRAAGSAIPIPIPMMKLGSGNALSLFDPADPKNVGIVLSPFGQTILGPYPNSAADATSDRTQGVLVIAAGKKTETSVVPLNAMRVLDDGTILIQRSGDIGMGEFIAGPQP